MASGSESNVLEELGSPQKMVEAKSGEVRKGYDSAEEEARLRRDQASCGSQEKCRKTLKVTRSGQKACGMIFPTGAHVVRTCPLWYVIVGESYESYPSQIQLWS